MCGNASLKAARWVGQNSGPIFHRMRTKVYRTNQGSFPKKEVWER